MPAGTRKHGISYHILPAAATLMGVSLTALVLFQGLKNGKSTIIDDLIAIDGVIFSVSAILSYLSIKKESQLLEDISDAAFFVGLGLANVISVAVVVMF